MAVIDPPGAVNFSKQPDESEPYSSAPEYEPYLSDSSVSASEPTVQPRDKYIDSESESDMNDGDEQPTEKDVFGSSSEDEDANEDRSDKAASDSDSAVECYSEDDDDAESDTECACAQAAREKEAEWDRYIIAAKVHQRNSRR